MKPQEPPSRTSNYDGFKTLNENQRSTRWRKPSRALQPRQSQAARGEASTAAPRQIRQLRRRSAAGNVVTDEEQEAPGGAQIHPHRKKIDHEPCNIVGEEDANAAASTAIVDIDKIEEIYSPAQEKRRQQQEPLDSSTHIHANTTEERPPRR